MRRQNIHKQSFFKKKSGEHAFVHCDNKNSRSSLTRSVDTIDTKPLIFAYSTFCHIFWRT